MLTYNLNKMAVPHMYFVFSYKIYKHAKYILAGILVNILIYAILIVIIIIF
jgi:hypothetical protein